MPTPNSLGNLGFQHPANIKHQLERALRGYPFQHRLTIRKLVCGRERIAIYQFRGALFFPKLSLHKQLFMWDTLLKFVPMFLLFFCNSNIVKAVGKGYIQVPKPGGSWCYGYLPCVLSASHYGKQQTPLLFHCIFTQNFSHLWARNHTHPIGTEQNK